MDSFSILLDGSMEVGAEDIKCKGVKESSVIPNLGFEADADYGFDDAAGQGEETRQPEYAFATGEGGDTGSPQRLEEQTDKVMEEIDAMETEKREEENEGVELGVELGSEDRGKEDLDAVAEKGEFRQEEEDLDEEENQKCKTEFEDHHARKVEDTATDKKEEDRM